MNEEQKRAAEWPNGYVQILAGPGTGKTTTLVARIVALIRRGIDPARICVLSFTRAAARELKARVALELEGNVPLVIGTFHSIAYRLLRVYGGPQFSELGVIDEREKADVLMGLLGGEDLNKRDLLKAVTARQVFGTTADPTIEHVLKQYTQLLNSQDRVDFESLLTTFYDHLTSPQCTIPSRFDAVLVDEFQDSSFLQLKIAVALASQCRNLTVVGDPDQSIYAFRHANPRVFSEMHSLVGEVAELYLNTNYRSTQSILDAAQRTILQTSTKRRDRLKSVQGGCGGPVKYVACASSRVETLEIADHIAYLVECGVQPHEISVLARQSSAYRGLETELMLRGIRARCVGGRKPQFTSKESRAVVDYLRVALNNNDQLAISRTLNYPPRKIGPATAQKVYDKATNLPSMRFIRQHREPSFAGYTRIVDELSSLLGSQGIDEVRAAVTHCCTTLFTENLAAHFLDMVDEFAQQINEDLEEDNRSFAQKLVSIWALGASTTESEPQSMVTLSTIHSAKGLEWPVVFVLSSSTSPYEKSGEDVDADDVSEEEEVRLLYVALTRAKSYLIITSPSDTMDKRLGITPATKKNPAIATSISTKIDFAALSRCTGREIAAPPPKPRLASTGKPTQLGDSIPLADGFVLASDLPMPKPKSKPHNNIMKEKPKQKARKNSILAYFQSR